MTPSYIFFLTIFLLCFWCIPAEYCSRYYNKCGEGYVCCNNQCHLGSSCVGQSCYIDNNCLTSESCCEGECWGSDTCLGHSCLKDNDCSSGQKCCMYLCTSSCDNNLGSGFDIMVIGIVFACIFGVILLIGAVIVIIACCRRKPSVGHLNNQATTTAIATNINYQNLPSTSPLNQPSNYQPPPYGTVVDPMSGQLVYSPYSPYEERVFDSEVVGPVASGKVV